MMNEKAAVFANCSGLWKLRRNRATKTRMRVQPEPGPYRIWIPVRTASANRDRRIRHKSPCRGARIGRDSPLFFSFFFSLLLSSPLFSSLPSSPPFPLPCQFFLAILRVTRHRPLSVFRHNQASQNTFQSYL